MGWDRPPGRTLFGRESRKRANCCVETRNAWELVNSSRRSLVGTETSAWEVESSPNKTLFGNSRERVRFSLGNEGFEERAVGLLTREMVKTRAFR